ncbi:MAG: sugar transferase [Lachnospiraceae bacterium]|nr:sugar transferase [Lachnospiraceae bacterium]
MRRFEDLPEDMRTPEVKEYYDCLVSRRAYRFLKRAFDIAAASVLTVILLIPMAVIAVRIKMSSPGPVFFRQTRVTRYGKTFRIFKFRTMVTDAEAVGPQVTMNEDPRVTPIGHALREHRLDEIPQLFNILAGSMTFVGTRPEVPKYVACYTPVMRATLLMPAGLTSRTSIAFKDEAQMLAVAESPEEADRIYVEEVLPRKMKYNLENLKNGSCREDLSVLFQTIGVVKK